MPTSVAGASYRRLSLSQLSMLIAILRLASCVRRDPACGMVRRSSMWAVGEVAHHDVDGKHLLDFGLLVRDEAPDAGSRHGTWGYGRRYLPTAAARARFVALPGASSGAT